MGSIPATYSDKVLSYSPFAYWPMWETAGVTADCLTSPLYDGFYNGPTVGNGVGPDGSPCPLFDGNNDFVDLDVVSLDVPFNGAIGSAMIWARVFNAGVWSDGAYRLAYEFGADTNNRIFQGRHNINNFILGYYFAGGVNESDFRNVGGNLEWFHLALTWTKAAPDQVVFYYNAIPITSSTLGVWAGALSDTWTAIGARNTTPNDPWKGWLAHCALWDRVLTPAEVTDLATV